MGLNNALGIRSHFSLGESLLKVEDIVAKLKEYGYESAAIVDTMGINTMGDFTVKCKDAGIKPIIGVRLHIVDDPTYKRPPKSAEEKALNLRPWYPKLFALNEDGLRVIFRLLTKANSEERFYYEPRLGLDDLLDELKSAPDAVAFATGDALSVFHHAEHIEILRKISSVLSASKTFCELVPADSPLFDKLNKLAIVASQELDLPTLVTYPAFYLDKDDADTAEVNDAIQERNTISEVWYRRPHVRDFTLKPIRDIVAASRSTIARMEKRYGTACHFRDYFVKGLQNTDTLVSMVEFVWDKMKPCLPNMAADPYKALVDECKKGWASRFSGDVFGYSPPKKDLTEIYFPRLQYELSVLKKMGFEDYFLLVQDIVKWSKDNDIAVGPGRGSVGGSLVAYLLGITDVDPIRFNLLFERFINPERLDLPDADLDFMSERRSDVIAYITDRYGSDRVAGISNYQVLQAASALKDVARVHEIDLEEMAFTKLVPKEHGKPLSLEEAATAVGEIARFKTTRPDVWNHATKLEGVMRSYGRHAAGIVVAGEPLVNRSAIERRKDGATVNWDKRIVEDMGLVKMDILGLSTLDLLEETKKYIWERHSKKINLLDIPLDDTKVYENFGKGLTTGVFQFESAGMAKLLKKMGSDKSLNFNDLMATTALYRPGPLDAGLVDEYVNRRAGREFVTYDHPAVENALKDTYGVMVYQEELMQVSRDLCGFSMPEADKLRKAVGKKLKSEMVKMKDKFIEGATAGFVEVELEDGTIKKVHRKQKFKVKETSDVFTIEEVMEKGYTLSE